MTENSGAPGVASRVLLQGIFECSLVFCCVPSLVPIIQRPGVGRGPFRFIGSPECHLRSRSSLSQTRRGPSLPSEGYLRPRSLFYFSLFVCNSLSLVFALRVGDCVAGERVSLHLLLGSRG